MKKQVTKRELSIVGASVVVVMLLIGGIVITKHRSDNHAEEARMNRHRALESGYEPGELDANGAPVETEETDSRD